MARIGSVTIKPNAFKAGDGPATRVVQIVVENGKSRAATFVYERSIVIGPIQLQPGGINYCSPLYRRVA